MLRQLIKFEFIYQSRQLAFWFFSLIFFLFGWMVGRGIYAPDNVIYNSTYNIAKYTGLLSLAVVFSIMFQVVSGVLRDAQFKFSDLLYATPLRKWDYFISRYIGVFAFSVFVLTVGLLGIAISASVGSQHAARVVPIDWSGLLQIWSFIVVPTVFIMTAIIFAVAMLTKNVLATYATAVFIYALYWLCAIFFNSPLLVQSVPADPANLYIAAMADPFGLSAFFENTQYWTTYEQSYSTHFFSGSLQWNRILWLLFSSALLVLVYRLTDFRYKDVKRKKRIASEAIEIPSIKYQSQKTEVNILGFHWQSFKSLLRMDTNYILKSWPFMLGVLMWGILLFIELFTRINAGGGYSEKIYPSTGYLIEIISAPLPFLSLLLIIFYCGELVWRSRDLKSFLIIDATPTSNIAFFLSQVFTLSFIPLIFITIGIAMAIGFQLAYGYRDIEPGLYLSMFYFDSIRPFLYILLSIFIQNLLNNKYLGMFVSGLLILLFGTSLVEAIGVEHPMLQINRLPGLVYSQLLGYGDYIRPFNYFTFYWGAFGLLLAMTSFSLWRRGMLESLKIRLRKALNLQTRTTYAFWSVAGILFLIAGGNLWYHIHFVQEYKPVSERLDIQAAYELKYKKYTELPRLYQVDIQLEVDLYPAERRYDYRARHTLENKNSTPVKTVLISERAPLSKVVFNAANLIEKDTLLSAWLYELKEPLLPGERVDLVFEINKNNPVLNPGRDIVENGSFVLPININPVIGYRPSREIRDAEERKRRNLPPREEEEIDVHHLHTGNAAIGKVPYSAIVSTGVDQIALSSGNLVRSWNENGRSYFEYKTQENVVPLLSIISGKFARRKDTLDDLVLEQYYHPEHSFNIAAIKEYTEATLKYCQENFGPYPFDHLRIVEIPGHWPFGGIAMPGMISMVEDRLYTVDVSDTTAFNLVAKRTIHEVSHQWWGHILMAKNVEGGSLLVEGLAKYTEALMMEKIFGKWSLIQLGKTANHKYFTERSMSSKKESPLFLADGEDFLSYGKMYTVMLALKNLIGEDVINEVLRNLVDKHRAEIDPTAISIELIEAFYEVTPENYHSLIDDWFKKVINYDLQISAAKVEALNDGRYEVLVDIKAGRTEMLADGSEKSIEINEPITIGLYSDDPEKVFTEEQIIYLGTPLIQAEQQQLRIIVDQKPAVVVVDPYLTRTDKNWVDNYYSFD